MENIVNVPQEYKTNRNILKDVLPIDLPYSVSIEPTNICNFKCVMCTQGSEKYGKLGAPFVNIDMECFKKTIDDLKKWCHDVQKKVKVIRLYSTGEPLLHPQIGEMVRLIKDADICDMMEITTNGSRLDKKMAEQFVEYGLDYIRFSIYSVYNDKNLEITRSKVTPEEIRENVKYIKQYRDSRGKNKPFIQAKMIDTYSEENKDFELYYNEYVDEVAIDQPMNSSVEDGILQNLYHEKTKEVNEAVKSRLLFTKKKACRYPFTHLTIRSDGNVCVCCNDYLKQTSIGNVMNQDLETLWNSEKLYNFRIMQLKTKGINHPACAKCEVPLRDCREDDIDDFDASKLTYRR